MDNKRIVITGVGVIAPNGIGKENFWQALKDGRSGIKPIKRFDTSEFKCKQAGEIDNFKPADFLGDKGLRDLDRTTRLLCSAAKLAIDDAKFEVNADNTDDIGVCTGTTLSSLWKIAEFNKQVIQDGPLFTDVALFPGTVANAASSYVSIRFNIQGFNTTISNGYTSSLDALRYAKDFINFGRVKAVLVCSAESMSVANYTGFNILGFLAGLKGQEISCPFDKRRNGIILSECAAAIMLEDEEYAKRRKAQIFAQVKGISNSFDAKKLGKYNSQATGLQFCMKTALAESNFKPKDIDYISASANSVFQQDALEVNAIKRVFEKRAYEIPVSSIKSMIGESFSCAGLMQLTAGLASINNSFVPPTINYNVKDSECDLDFVPNISRKKNINNILINNMGPSGNNAVAVLSKYKS
jgi:3-oxoacyl-[acyl-carrier-protein] synthase II